MDFNNPLLESGGFRVNALCQGLNLQPLKFETDFVQFGLRPLTSGNDSEMRIIPQTSLSGWRY
jgi:hypothetical protein